MMTIFAIDAGGGLVEDDNGGVTKDASEKKDDLSHTSTKVFSTLTGHGIKTGGSDLTKDVFEMLGADKGLDLIGRCLGAVDDIGHDGAVEETGILVNIGDFFAEISATTGFNVNIVHEDLALSESEKSKDQAYKGGFSRSRISNQNDAGTSGNGEIEMSKYRI